MSFVILHANMTAKIYVIFAAISWESHYENPYSPVLRFLQLIFISSTIYFRVVPKVFDSLLSGGYDISRLKIVLKVLDNFFCHNK